jgi:hypothetical protein
VILATGWPAERVERRVSLRIARALMARHRRAESIRFLELVNVVRGADPQLAAKRYLKVIHPETEDEDATAAYVAYLARRAEARGDKPRADRLARQARLYAFLDTLPHKGAAA